MTELKDDMIKIVNAAKEDTRIEVAKYIMDKYPTVFKDLDVAKKVAKMLISETRASKNQILSGNFDYKIKKYANYEILRNQSLENEQKEDLEPKIIPLKTKKREISRETLKGLIVGLIAVVGVAYIGNAVVKIVKEDIKKANDPGMDILPTDEEYKGNENYESKTNIVKDNTVIVGVTENGNQIVSYHYDKMATSILELYEKNPELLEFYFQDVFFSFSPETALNNMDSVLNELKLQTRNNDSYKEIYEKIFDHQVFLEYLLDEVIDENSDKNYDDYLIAISAYKKKIELTDSNKWYNQILVEKYEDLRKIIEEKYADMISSLNSGGRQ